MSVNGILENVADKFGCDVADLKGRCRTADIALARQVAMYILLMRKGFTLQVVGNILGGRTPATVSYGFQVVAIRRKENSGLLSLVDNLMNESGQQTVRRRECPYIRCVLESRETDKSYSAKLCHMLDEEIDG